MVRNVAAGSLVKRYGIEEGRELECPIIEYYLKDEERKDPMINEDHVISFGHATSGEIREMHRLASKTNAILKAFFRRRNLKLIDFCLEFGRLDKKIAIGDEISADTCHFWDLLTNEGMPTESVAQAEKVYKELKKRMASAD
jgi:phosphoribosylaminoimidazole-succinocarboxamide synthase